MYSDSSGFAYDQSGKDAKRFNPLYGMDNNNKRSIFTYRLISYSFPKRKRNTSISIFDEFSFRQPKSTNDIKIKKAGTLVNSAY
jgi:hypothetical protein